MNDDVVVREGTLADFDAGVRLVMAAVAENALVPPDYPRLLEHVYAALTRDHGIAGVIGEPGGELEGAILLRVGQVWYSSEPVLEEKAIFVAPNFRSAKGGRARKLAEWGKMASDRLGLPLAIGVLSNARTEGKVKLYERMFGPPAGVYFLYGGKTGTVVQPPEGSA